MRRIGNLSDQKLAERFCDYLVTLSIDAAAESRLNDPPGGGVSPSWDIWIREEQHVDRARDELQRFEANPGDQRFAAAAEAGRIREKKAAEQARRLKNQPQRPKWSDSGRLAGGALAGMPVRQQGIPVTIGIIIVSVILSFITNLGRPRVSPRGEQPTLEERAFNGLSFVDFRDYQASRGDSFASVRKGQIWRIVTPMFLHGNTMHLAFNMLWIYFLGSALERLHGSLFAGLLVFVTHILGMMLQVMMPGAESLPALLVQLAGSPFAIGASGAVYGLFGFLLIRPLIDPSYPIRMVPMNVALMLGWLVFCMLPMFDMRIANGAHLGGLLAGMAIAPLMARRQSGSF